jgi:hypothetical protein
VTYNFDPDRWYENERLRIGMRRAAGELTEEEATSALDEADSRYEAMLARLDGTFPVASRPVPKAGSDRG